MTTKRFLTNPTPEEMPATADVVIIGGGPAGAAAAWALERADPTLSIVLIEKTDRLAAGSSTASLENFRTCWPTPCLMKQMKRSVEVFLNADDYLGAGAQDALAVKMRGYLYCGFDDRQAEQLRRDVAHLHNIGLTHVEYLDADEVQKRFPWLGPAVCAAKYDPRAGWLDSNALTYKFVQSTQSTTVLLGVSQTGIRAHSGRIVGVSTSYGDIDAPTVIIAAGAWARQVALTAGVELPIVVRPRQNITTHWRHEAYPEDGPCVIGGPPYPHLRPEARTGAIIGWEFHWNNKHVKSPDEPTCDYLLDPLPSVDTLKDPRFPSMVLLLLARQFQHPPGYGFADSRYLRGLWHNIGYYVYRAPWNTYSIAPDGQKRPYESQRAIIGPWSELSGLFLSVAHVGHGIMSAPAAGEIIAAHVLGHPLPEPEFADFGVDVHYVEHDAGGL